MTNKNWAIKFTYNTNAIEGNPLDYVAVCKILKGEKFATA